jgi:hypothetical protein
VAIEQDHDTDPDIRTGLTLDEANAELRLVAIEQNLISLKHDVENLAALMRLLVDNR